uniref:Putative ATP-binding protein n=1 Tax=uncultured bacterium contig00062 TaxID=1181545 RepID=A0A806K147_9BACT|nr:putative ATP-binding protein [uncultured bacterium contig00062]
MLGEEFGFMVIAHPISTERNVQTIEKELYAIYDEISRSAKQSFQKGTNESEQTGSSETKGTGTNATEGSSDTEGTTRGTNKGTSLSHSTNEGTSQSHTTNEGTNQSHSKNEGTSQSHTTNEGTNQSHSKNEGASLSHSTNEGTSQSHSKNEGENSSFGTSETKSSGSSSGGSSSSTNKSETKGTNDSRGTSTGSSDTSGKSKGSSDTAGTSTGSSDTSGTSKGTSDTTGTSKGSSDTTGTSTGSSDTNGTTKGTSDTSGTTEGTNFSESISKSKNISSSTSTSESNSTNKGKQTGVSESITTELTNKNLQEWLKYFDEVILPRLDYGYGKGIFVTSSLLWANNERVLKKLGNTTTALFAGEKGNRIPFIVRRLELENNYLKALRLFQQPVSREMLAANSDDWKREVIWSHTYLPDNDNQVNFYLGNWMSVKELAVMAGVPQKEVVGLRLKEEIEFGLNVGDKMDGGKEINLGKLVVSGNPKEIPVNISVSDLDRHIFVTGVTGSGKTTTCQKLLIDSGLPFMIIEPAKTEYRILKEYLPDIKIFTIGSDVAPLKLNPFQFFEGENITSRVDMIKASIEAAFDMEAAIPQIIEQVIYDSYKEKGWNIANSKNSNSQNPFSPDEYLFPTIADVLRNVEKSVSKHKFDERLKNDYKGSITARLQGLILGSKGMMLNCCHSVDFGELLDQKVIIELEELRDGGQKSLVIGFVLMNMVEAIRRRFDNNHGKKVPHITLIEEAHRLLSKPQPGDTNRQHGVDTFTDMLAEIRKYGESLIISDQIPNKLTPEILKNTNTKIVHRIFAQDDKDAIGNTMALTEEQRNFLSNLDVGRAIVFNGNWPKAVQVQIPKKTDTSKEIIISRDELKASNLDFYISHWESNIVDYSTLFGHKPSREEMEILMQLRNNSDYINAMMELKESGENQNKQLIKPLEDLLQRVPDKKRLFDILADNYLNGHKGSFLSEIYDMYQGEKVLDKQKVKTFANSLMDFM